MKPKQFSHTSESILARIANKTYIELGVNVTTLKGLIYRFVKSLNIGKETTLYHTRINLFNDLTKNVMTFKVFMKMLRVLNVSRVIFKITVFTAEGKEVTVTEDVSLNTIPTDTNKDDEK
jgi:hypothetical protein